MRAELARLHDRLAHDDGLRHPRPDRGDDAGAARDRDAERSRPAGRPPAGALSRPGQPLRRRVHRIAVDEPRRSDGRRRATSSSRATGCRSRPVGIPVRTGPVILGIRPGRLRGRRPCRPRPADGRGRGRCPRGARLGEPRHLRHRRPARSRRRSSARRTTTRTRSSLAEGGSLFTARVDPRTSPRVGTTVTLAVNPAGFHFFDPDTGQTLRARAGELAATAS